MLYFKHWLNSDFFNGIKNIRDFRYLSNLLKIIVRFFTLLREFEARLCQTPNLLAAWLSMDFGWSCSIPKKSLRAPGKIYHPTGEK